MPAAPRPGGIHPHPRTALRAARGALRRSRARIAHSSQPHATVSHDTADLMVLTDYLIADPRLTSYLVNP
jgi:hypothetical protein